MRSSIFTLPLSNEPNLSNEHGPQSVLVYSPTPTFICTRKNYGCSKTQFSLSTLGATGQWHCPIVDHRREQCDTRPALCLCPLLGRMDAILTVDPKDPEIYDDNELSRSGVETGYGSWLRRTQGFSPMLTVLFLVIYRRSSICLAHQRGSWNDDYFR